MSDQQPEHTSGSPTSIRDHFAEEIKMARPREEKPFDEPSQKPGHRRKYSLDGCKFYQSTEHTEDGYTLENRPLYSISQDISSIKSEQPATMMMHNHYYNDMSENSTISSYLGNTTYHAPDSDTESESEASQLMGDCHDCDTLVATVQALCGLPATHHPSKPQPIVWEEYTCLKGADPQEPPTGDSRNDDSKSYANQSRHGAVSVQSELTFEQVPENPSQRKERSHHQKDEYYPAKVVHEYLDYAKTTAQDFLKKSIFVDDPKTFQAKDTVIEDTDSMTNGSQ